MASTSPYSTSRKVKETVEKKSTSSSVAVSHIPSNDDEVSSQASPSPTRVSNLRVTASEESTSDDPVVIPPPSMPIQSLNTTDAEFIQSPIQSLRGGKEHGYDDGSRDSSSFVETRHNLSSTKRSLSNIMQRTNDFLDTFSSQIDEGLTKVSKKIGNLETKVDSLGQMKNQDYNKHGNERERAYEDLAKRESSKGGRSVTETEPQKGRD